MKKKYANQRQFWSTIKPYINSRKCKHSGRIVLKDNEKIIRDQKEVAETLNKFFTSFDREEQHSGMKRTPVLTHIQQNLSPKPALSLTKTSPIEVNEVTKKIKTNKATSCDRIPPRAIKESAEILCHPFSKLFNFILDCSRIPQKWKLGEISPVFKKDCSLSKINYKPLTILPSLSKVFVSPLENRPLFRRHFSRICARI